MVVKKNRLVFVVEDDKLYNKIIVNFLKKNGFKKVVPFFNGRDCVKAIDEGQNPEIVIQDYFLGDTTGEDIFNYVKENSKHTKFIFLTAHDDMDLAVDVIKFGAVDYIVKENDPALKRLYREVLRASKILEVEKRNLFVKNAMILTLIILIAIVAFVILDNIFHLI